MNIGENIKKICSEKGITQKELAERIGISDNSLSMTLSNSRPRWKTLEKVSEALGVTIVQLILSTDEISEITKGMNAQSGNAKTLRCPHCGKPITLFVKAEDASENEE